MHGFVKLEERLFQAKEEAERHRLERNAALELYRPKVKAWIKERQLWEYESAIDLFEKGIQEVKRPDGNTQQHLIDFKKVLATDQGGDLTVTVIDSANDSDISLCSEDPSEHQA